jgi:hypothetical protein
LARAVGGDLDQQPRAVPIRTVGVGPTATSTTRFRASASIF